MDEFNKELKVTEQVQNFIRDSMNETEYISHYDAGVVIHI